MNSSELLLEKARAYLRLDAAQLDRMADQLDPALAAAVPVICTTIQNGGKLLLSGIGKSYHIACKAAATFTSTGSTAVPLHPAEAPHGDLGMLRDGDAVLLLSYSGESRELVHLVPFLRRGDVKLISITGSTSNSLARQADIAICAPIEREACPFNLAPTTSALVTLAVCDVLAMLVQEELGFTRETYKKFHPGGSIGESLSLTVQDIMRSGERLPSCHLGQTVQDAVLVMTKCKAGAVGVLDADEKLVGVFTDGDLRRILTESLTPASVSLESAMTRSPIAISPDAPATEALKIFEQHNIDDLLVVTTEGSLVGIVDLQDIPKLKIFKDD
jgi:arabinose-5-phosphate isomerase